ncbi:MAG: metallophosphoesterase family protein, partial [Chloroflexota bacterium]|nr:metallophosphoesterase family protein [Chloroflexota bacterium]
MPDIHRIGVISDTHIPSRVWRIPDAALRHFEGVELIVHAGDHSTRSALDQLAAYAPVEAVQGNVED